MAKIAIITDSSCDLPDDLLTELDIHVVPLKIRIDGNEFIDKVDLSTKEFWSKSRLSNSLPETAAPSPGDFLQVFQQCASNGYEAILCLTISSELSATYQSAMTASKDSGLTIPIEVIDSRQVTIALGLIVVRAARSAKQDNFETVIQQARDSISKIIALGTLDTLENLKKGGRIGSAQAFLGSVLSIKPVVQIINGKVEAESRQRTRSKALNHLIEVMREVNGVNQIGIAHAQASDIDQFLDKVRNDFTQAEIIVSEMGAVLGTHVGPGTIAMVASS